MRMRLNLVLYLRMMMNPRVLNHPRIKMIKKAMMRKWTKKKKTLKVFKKI